MPRSVKVSISLPERFLQHAERELRRAGESRSELFRRALESLSRERRREAAVRSYVEGYVAEPESAGEVSAAEAAARAVWDEQHWDDGERD